MDTPQGRGSAHHGTPDQSDRDASRRPARGPGRRTTPAGTNQTWEHSARSGASPDHRRTRKPAELESMLIPRHNGFSGTTGTGKERAEPG